MNQFPNLLVSHLEAAPNGFKSLPILSGQTLVFFESILTILFGKADGRIQREDSARLGFAESKKLLRKPSDVGSLRSVAGLVANLKRSSRSHREHSYPRFLGALGRVQKRDSIGRYDLSLGTGELLSILTANIQARSHVNDLNILARMQLAQVIADILSYVGLSEPDLVRDERAICRGAVGISE